MDEDNVSVPTGTDFYEYVSNLRTELLTLETDKEAAVELLYEITEATDPDDIEETLLRIKKFLEVSF